jgi:hypothetical protein
MKKKLSFSAAALLLILPAAAAAADDIGIGQSPTQRGAL